MLPFYTPWKQYTTKEILVFSEGRGNKIGTLARNWLTQNFHSFYWTRLYGHLHDEDD